jgi:YidC/Oxa1 family membrane protein insertase
LLVPLTLKQFHSMQRLQTLQPQMKAIQQKYKDDKQRQQQEIMKFYKENQVNPFGSCLPLVLQLPVFVSLFYMLRSTLRHDICPHLNPAHIAHTRPCGPHGGASFLFIPDLTQKVTHHTGVLITLIVLYVGTQLGATAVTALSADKNQRIMFALPFVFTIFIVNFQAGLIVYWITTNVWTIGQQLLVRKLYPKPPPRVPTEEIEPARPARGKPVTVAGSADGKGAGRKQAAKTGPNGRGAKPPPSPRKKKKRSGRRR